MVVAEGSNVTLRCAATGSPTPTITWRREGGESISLASGNEGKFIIFYIACVQNFTIFYRTPFREYDYGCHT